MNKSLLKENSAKHSFIVFQRQENNKWFTHATVANTHRGTIISLSIWKDLHCFRFLKSIWQGVAWIQQEGANGQKINYEANNDRNLTKLTTHCLDLYQIEVWPFFRPQLPPIMVITAHIYSFLEKPLGNMCEMLFSWINPQNPPILVNFLAGQENHPTFNIYRQLWPWWGVVVVEKMVKPQFGIGLAPWSQNPYMGFKVVHSERLNFEKKQKYLQNHNEICQHSGGGEE